MSESDYTPLDISTLPVGAERKIVPIGVDPSQVTVVQAYDPTSGGSIDDAPIGFGRALLDMASSLPTFGGTSPDDSTFKSSEAVFRPSGQWAGSGQDYTWSDTSTNTPDSTAFVLANAARTLTRYIYVRLQGRGDAGADAFYSFLVNPKTLTVDRQVVDVQAQARGGWQLGIWGDDIISISMSGQTAGQYFAAGLSTRFQEYTLSYKNFLALLALFQNNGYWYEGESMGDGPLAPDVTRNRIQKHADVILCAGNFIWYGLFQDLTFVEDAAQPHIIHFNLSFMAWKEQFSKNSSWRNSIRTDIYRGHSYERLQQLSQVKEAAAATDAQMRAQAEAKALSFVPSDTPPAALRSLGLM